MPAFDTFLSYLITILIVSRAQELVVSQPRSAQGTEGRSITLRCSYNYISKPKVGSYQWVKDPGLVVVKNSTPEFTGRVNCTSDHHFLLDQRADLEIRDLRHYDSGIYRCVVSLYGVQEASGNGTKLQVMKAAGASKDNEKEKGVSLLMGLGPGLGSVLVASAAVPLMFLYCRKRQGENEEGRP
ncbi:natural cytotoxicity triggering receptor 3-like [Heteronotia binoei]|uniref:natural cytotoxicity triggering receptor 3-like n=1 Tax=Heteronotia binoei TaxID=13085 RepID=UPI0029313895|nr:natural cytotoxicity triggering receptor 3-like [Heteronotia binoei]